MRSKEYFKKRFLYIVPFTWQDNFARTLSDMIKIMKSFFKGQFIAAFLIGVFEFIGLKIIGVDYAPLLAIIGGVSNMVPVIGPIIGAVPSIAIALISSPIKAAFVLFLFIFVQQIDNFFISPRVVEGRLGIHPVVTIIVIIIGGELFGILGIFLAIPVFSMLKVIFTNSFEKLV